MWILKPLLLIDLLEDVFETTVILLQDGVLGAQVQRPGFRQSHLEGAVSKVPDGTISIVHSHSYTTSAWRDIQTHVNIYQLYIHKSFIQTCLCGFKYFREQYSMAE